MSFAIGTPGGTKVTLWCEGTPKPRKDGSVPFYVTNGCWNGTLRDGRVFVDRYGTDCGPGAILWSGTVPHGHRHYNDAIAWIEQQLGHPTKD